MIITGGYPAAVERSESRRARFFESYLDTIIDRDLTTIARVHDQANVRRVLSAVASMAASLLNFDGLGRDLGLAANSVRSYSALLETLFLIARSEAWSDTLFTRVVKAPKIYISDSGLHAYLVGADSLRIIADGRLSGMMFENFVATDFGARLPGRTTRPDCSTTATATFAKSTWCWSAATARLSRSKSRPRLQCGRVTSADSVTSATSWAPGSKQESSCIAVKPAFRSRTASLPCRSAASGRTEPLDGRGVLQGISGPGM